jgi:hypothetical protein
MQALLWLSIAYRFGDEAVRLLDLEDSSQHELSLVVVGED